MDWKEIEKKFPKAHQKLDKLWNISANSDIYGNHYPHFRGLYDFFDGEGIFVEIGAPIGDTPQWGYWDYDIAYPIAGQMEYYRESGWENYKTRTEAEEQAFIEAFSQLEKQLKGK